MDNPQISIGFQCVVSYLNCLRKLKNNWLSFSVRAFCASMMLQLLIFKRQKKTLPFLGQKAAVGDHENHTEGFRSDVRAEGNQNFDFFENLTCFSDQWKVLGQLGKALWSIKGHV